MIELHIRKRSHLASLLGVAVTFGASVRATPMLTVSIQGTCPSRQQLRGALEAVGLSVVAGADPMGYEIRASTDPTGAQLLLRRSGKEVLRRSLQSSDCEVLAGAMAAVVDAYFAELGATEQTPPSEPRDGIETSSETPFPEPIASASPPPPEATAPAAARAPQRPRSSAQPSVTSITPVDVPVAGAATVLPRAFLGIGPSLELPSGITTLGASLVAGVDLTAVPLSLELASSSGLRADSSGTPPRVERWATQLLARVGVPLALGLRYRPWLAVGDTLARLKALDFLPSSAQMTHSPSVGLGVAVEIPIGANWYPSLDLGCVLLVRRDRYVSTDRSTNVFGQGPRNVCGVSLGFTYGGMPTKR